MILSTIFLALISGSYAAEGDTMPFDYFLNPQQDELSRVVPLPFQPDDGINYRQSYEGKYGRRGERLIALLGGGVSPLSIFDASLFGKKTSDTTTTATVSPTPAESRVEEVTVSNEERNDTSISSTTTSPVDEESTPSNTGESYFNGRKYVEIDRRNPESFLQNIIPQESYNVSPEGVIYKRLYGAVWNFGEKGLQRRFPPSFLPSSWPFLPSPFDAPSAPIITDESSKSESAYAGPGEPSIILQSYSYER